MEVNLNLLSPEEFDRQESQLFQQGDSEALVEFYHTHSILYTDPVLPEVAEQLKDVHFPEVPNSANEMPFEDLFDLK